MIFSISDLLVHVIKFILIQVLLKIMVIGSTNLDSEMWFPSRD